MPEPPTPGRSEAAKTINESGVSGGPEQPASDLTPLISDASPALLWCAGADPSARRFAGISSAFTGRPPTTLEGRGWLSSVHPEDRGRVTGALQSAAESQEIVDLEYRVRRFDGEHRWVRDRGRPVFADDGALQGYAGAMLDVSDYELRPGAAPRGAGEDERLHRENCDLRAELTKLSELCRRLRDTTEETKHALDEKQAELDRLSTAKHAVRSPNLNTDAPALRGQLAETRAYRRIVRRIAADLLANPFAQSLDEILSGACTWRRERLDEQQSEDLERCRSAIRAMRTHLRSIVDLSNDPHPDCGAPRRRTEVFLLRRLLEEEIDQAGRLAGLRPRPRGGLIDLDLDVPDLVRGAAEHLRLIVLYAVSHAAGFAFASRLSVTAKFDGEPETVGTLRVSVCGDAWLSEPPDFSFVDEMEDEDAADMAQWPGPEFVSDEDDLTLGVASGVATGLSIARALCEILDGGLSLDLDDSGRFEIRFTLPLVRISNPDGGQRRHVRVPVETLTCNFGRVMDLSQSGVSIECDTPPPTEVVLEFAPPGDESKPLAVPAHVVWSRRVNHRIYHVGLRFLNLSDKMAADLAHLAADHSERCVNDVRAAVE